MSPTKNAREILCSSMGDDVNSRNASTAEQKGLLMTLFAAALLSVAAGAPVYGQTAQNFVATTFEEIETKYIFGFTEGSGIGLQGEKEFSIETIGRFGKRDGRYAATDTKLEFEYTPTQFMQVEFGGLVASYNIRNVTDLGNRNSFEFNGLFAELRYLLVERTPSSPFGVTISVEPEWRRTDETSGERVTAFELETKLAADTQLVENRVFLAFNAIYEPESVHSSQGLEKELNLIFSGALSFRPTPPLVIGGEVGYSRHYSGYALERYDGYSVFVGPTFYLQLTRKSFISAAWATQVSGHAVGDVGHLNLDEYSRQRGKIKIAVEF